MIGKFGRERLPHLIMKFQLFEKRSQGRPLQGCASLIGTATGQEAYIKNRCELDAVKPKFLKRGEM
jgi:hypothetical protein